MGDFAGGDIVEFGVGRRDGDYLETFIGALLEEARAEGVERHGDSGSSD